MKQVTSDRVRPGMAFIQELESDLEGNPRRRLWITMSHQGAGGWSCIYFQNPISRDANYSATGKTTTLQSETMLSYQYCGQIPKAQDLLDGVFLENRAELKLYDETDQEDDEYEEEEDD